MNRFNFLSFDPTQRWLWPLGCGSAYKHTALQTWWQHGHNGALNRKHNETPSQRQSARLLHLIVSSHAGLFFCCLLSFVLLEPHRATRWLTEIDPFRHFSSGHRQEDCSSAVLTRLNSRDRKVKGQSLVPTQKTWTSVCLFTAQFMILVSLLVKYYYNNGSDLLVFLQGHARLCSILSLDEDQLVSLDILQDTLQANVTPETTKTHKINLLLIY